MTKQKLEEARHLSELIESYQKRLHLLHNSKIKGLCLRHFDREKVNYEDILLDRDFPTGKIKSLLAEVYKVKIQSLTEKFEQL